MRAQFPAVRLAGLVVLGLMAFSGCEKSEPNPIVLIETSKGNIKAELFADKAPVSVKNFMRYVEKKHYDGLIFHRVMPDFMIQGGGMEPGMTERKTEAPIKNEAGNGLSNSRGTLAMARTADPHSATSQFYINVKDNRVLDRAYAQDGVGYAVFGRVLEGMDVADAISKVPTSQFGAHANVPKEDLFIKSIRRVDGAGK